MKKNVSFTLQKKTKHTFWPTQYQLLQSMNTECLYTCLGLKFLSVVLIVFSAPSLAFPRLNTLLNILYFFM